MRNSSGASQPITRHPLFPAIVALWSGAAFGLASVAIPPAMIERLVTLAHIDSIVPMAAPPLGATMRILLALGMTALGGVIGLMIARRITASPADSQARQDAGPAPVDATDILTAPPFAAPQSDTAPTFSRRRRALAMGNDGVAQNITTEPDEPAQVETTPSSVDRIADADSVLADTEQMAPLEATADRDLSPPMTEPEGNPVIKTDTLQNTDAPPVGPASVIVGAAGLRANDTDQDTIVPLGAVQAEANEKAQDKDRDPGSEQSPDIAASLPAWDAQPTDVTSPDRAERTNRLFENLAIMPDTTIRTPALDTPPVVEAAPRPAFNLLPRAGEDADRFVVPPFSLSELDLDPLEDEVSTPETADAQPSSPSPHDENAQGAQVRKETPQTAAQRIASSDLDALSPVELLERLAMAMTERRKAMAAMRAAQVTTDPTAQVVTPRSPTMPEFQDDLSQGPVVEETPGDSSRTTSSATILTDHPPVSRAVFNQSAQEHDDLAVVRSLDNVFAADTPTPMPRIPAALRPVPLDPLDSANDGKDVSDDMLPGYVPPRHMGLVSSTPAATHTSAAQDRADGTGEPATAFTPFVYTSETADHEEGEDDEAVLEGGYSSLLNLSRPARARQSFIRLDSGETAEDNRNNDIEDQDTPLVNSETVLSGTPDAQPTPRPFDAPSPESRLNAKSDAHATENALRAALATLQRMSGTG